MSGFIMLRDGILRQGASAPGSAPGLISGVFVRAQRGNHGYQSFDAVCGYGSIDDLVD
jgi:hypothetical protein